ncbi:ergothioneine biosynthesis protein EgtC [Phytohabitans kaempferiae]|uniref:Gamma-glutamyl-hercynylcysteine sulfoxide hydrolase n=1 Tax=Phytohabitans kaempferiae TaxID=1620943 RepID=A0ABV6M3Y2_9ACTN
MCRHLAYVGPPVALAALLLDPPHSLLRQSWAPRDMRGGGTINADGFGVGWYPPAPEATGGTGPAAASGVDGPVRLRRASPMWSDTGLAELARVTVSTAVLAAVRSATVGMPVVETANAPFAGDGLLLSHNGRIMGWPGSVADLARRLPVTDLLTLDAPTDAAFLWAFVRHRLRGGEDPATALAATVAEVTAAAPDSRLNLLLTDGHRIYATTAGHSLWIRPAETVPTRHTAEAQPGAGFARTAVGEAQPGAGSARAASGGAREAQPASGGGRHGAAGFVVVASEPFDDDPTWQPVPDRRLVVADPTTHTVEDL